jgi:hypothetical protein
MPAPPPSPPDGQEGAEGDLYAVLGLARGASPQEVRQMGAGCARTHGGGAAQRPSAPA